MLETHAKTQAKKKNPRIAVIASFFIPGLGQIYNGEIVKGIAFIIIGTIFGLLGIALTGPAIMAPVLFGFVLVILVIYFIFWIYNLYDAYNTAEKTMNEVKGI